MSMPLFSACTILDASGWGVFSSLRHFSIEFSWERPDEQSMKLKFCWSNSLKHFTRMICNNDLLMSVNFFLFTNIYAKLTTYLQFCFTESVDLGRIKGFVDALKLSWPS